MLDLTVGQCAGIFAAVLLMTFWRLWLVLYVLVVVRWKIWKITHFVRWQRPR